MGHCSLFRAPNISPEARTLRQSPPRRPAPRRMTASYAAALRRAPSTGMTPTASRRESRPLAPSPPTFALARSGRMFVRQVCWRRTKWGGATTHHKTTTRSSQRNVPQYQMFYSCRGQQN